MCPANICTSPVKLMYSAGKINTCPDWKITCPVRHVTTKFYMPWDKIYMPRACGHALMSSPDKISALVQIMAWCWPGDKPLSEPMLAFFYWRIHASLGLNAKIIGWALSNTHEWNFIGNLNNCIQANNNIWKSCQHHFDRFGQGSAG